MTVEGPSPTVTHAAAGDVVASAADRLSDGGLSGQEAARRLRERPASPRAAASRSYASIVRANLLTLFNLILLGFGVVTLAFGDWRDALFLSILIANATIGITQEARAKRALDRLALLVAPTARVVRDGAPQRLPVEQVVDGDLLRVQPGDQVVADGTVVQAEGLQLDQSILTGESEPVAAGDADELRSGAFVAEGTGAYVVTAVGRDSYAQRLLGEARSFRHPRSPLELGINRMLLFLTGLVVLLGALLGYGLWHRHAPLRDAVSTSAAGVVSLVPEGLVVLVSLTYAVASRRMARRGVLAQQLNAIESLASADVICTDKTGTLTEAALRVERVVPGPDVDGERLTRTLARYAASASARNATLEAVVQDGAAEPEAVAAEVPFSSRRRWSALQLADATYVLGAPELFALGTLAAVADRERDAGRRVVALARASEELESPVAATAAPPQAEVLGLVVLAERLREQTRETVAFFREQGVEVKVLSGDAPATVAAIARDAGIEVAGVLDGRELPGDPQQLAELAERTTVIGRISPEGKRDVVAALARNRHHVAMVGDGVNDVPALKAARLAIAQGSGTEMAKSVADLVLVDGNFAAVPALVAAGRQALRNLQRVAKLYATKSSFAAFLILIIGTTAAPYPLLPRHFTLTAALTIGIPTFFLALAPSSGSWRPDGFGLRVARFAVPVGVIVGVGVVASYLFVLNDLDAGVDMARTTATSVLVAVGLYLVLVLEGTGRRRESIVGMMCAVLLGLYVLVVLLPGTRAFFHLARPSVGLVATAVAGAAVSIMALWLSGFSLGSGTEREEGDDG